LEVAFVVALLHGVRLKVCGLERLKFVGIVQRRPTFIALLSHSFRVKIN
jgi:hypothetical protein